MPPASRNFYFHFIRDDILTRGPSTRRNTLCAFRWLSRQSPSEHGSMLVWLVGGSGPTYSKLIAPHGTCSRNHYLISFCPANTAMTPAATLNTAYSNAARAFPSLTKSPVTLYLFICFMAILQIRSSVEETCCLRFAIAITDYHARLATAGWLDLKQTGFAPVRLIALGWAHNWKLSYQNINNNKSHQKCRKIAVQILLVLMKTKLKIQLNSKTVMNPPLVNAEIKISP